MSEAIERTKRSLDLIPYILEHQGISLEELAKKFNVSTETLYEDLNLLFCCGLPGYTPLELIDISFDEGYVSVSNPQVLDVPRKLSKNELLRLHLGLELLQKFAPQQLLSRILKLQNNITSHLSFSSPYELIDKVSTENLKIVVEALQNGKTLIFDYSSANSDSLSKRTIEVHGIMENIERIYIEGQEQSSGEIKTFRLDRMKNLVVGEYAGNKIFPEVENSNRTKYKLAISKSAQSFLLENSSVILESHETENGYLALLGEVSEGWLISEIFAHGGEVTVQEPYELKLKIKEMANMRLLKS